MTLDEVGDHVFDGFEIGFDCPPDGQWLAVCRNGHDQAAGVSEMCHNTPLGSEMFSTRRPHGCSSGGFAMWSWYFSLSPSAEIRRHQASPSSTWSCIMKFSASFLS